MKNDQKELRAVAIDLLETLETALAFSPLPTRVTLHRGRAQTYVDRLRDALTTPTD